VNRTPNRCVLVENSIRIESPAATLRFLPNTDKNKPAKKPAIAFIPGIVRTYLCTASFAAAYNSSPVRLSIVDLPNNCFLSRISGFAW